MKKKVLLFFIVSFTIVFLVMNDYCLYNTPIGKITSTKDNLTETKTGYDGNHEYKEKYYNQEISATIMNGEYKGQTIFLTNNYTFSGAYDTKYSKGDRVFIESITEENGTLTGKLTGAKRDYIVAFILTFLFGLFLLVGGKSGIMTILSLGINLITFYIVLVLYKNGTNILLASIPMSIIFTCLLLFFMYGRGEKTWLSLIATLISVGITALIAFGTMELAVPMDWDFMDYLNQPYDQADAGYIFMAELLIGCLGAVTDVVVTIVITVDQIVTANPQASKKSLFQSCRNVGDDIVGTMINVMFLTNIAASIPFFILSMRNGISMLTIIKYNVSFELVRFLCGSIGVVLAIPISALVATYFYKRQVKINVNN